MGLVDKLSHIQRRMKVPKDMKNTFGNYYYRNSESIFEAFKPFSEEYKVSLTVSDEIVIVGDRIYVKAIAKLTDCETAEEISTTAFAREASSKKGMDDSQITGTASSYARKYAMNGLFLLDDTKDPDTDEAREEQNNKSASASGKINGKSGNEIEKLLEKLKSECVRTGVGEKLILQDYKGTKSIADLSEYQLNEVLKKMGKTPNKKE